MATTSYSAQGAISPSDQWVSMLRYDTAQRTSVNASGNKRTGDTYTDRAHECQANHHDSSRSLAAGSEIDQVVQDANKQGNSTQSGLEVTTISSPLLNRLPLTETISIPGPLTGENGVLIRREMQRLRHRHSQTKQRHWRIFAGSAMLLNLAPTTYDFVQYIYAYLSLSPSNWPLSKGQDGSQVSLDPLMWTLSLVNMSASAVAVLCAMLCGLYLRFSRRRSLATWMNWSAVITTVAINLVQCIVNLTLIVVWNKSYSASTSSTARTRNVSNRCQGTWALDVLWNAAEYSDISKTTGENVAGCARDAASSLRAYLISGGARLLIFLVVSAIWLKCLAQYNRSLQLTASSNDSIVESAEMRDLLLEEKEHKSAGSLRDDHSHTLPGAYRSLPLQPDLEVCEPQCKSVQSSSRELLPPRIDRFRWQRTSPSVAYEEKEQGDERELKLPLHIKEVSAGAWSIGVVSHLWNAVWGTQDDHGGKFSSTTRLHGIAADGRDEEPPLHNSQIHQRQATKLGVRGWFSRDTSGQASEDHCNDDVDDDEEQLLGAHHHSRMSSQENRAVQNRHVAAHLKHEVVQPDSDRSHEQYKRDQQSRIAFLAGLRNQDQQTRSDERPSSDTVRRSSQSAGDELPHMPELTHSRMEGAIDDTTSWQDASLRMEQEIFTRPDTGRERQAQQLYVRTLGKLVHKLSAIESEGSQERADQRSRSDRRSGSELY